MALKRTLHWPLAPVLLLVTILCSCTGLERDRVAEANVALIEPYETQWGSLRGSVDLGREMAKNICSACHVVDGVGQALYEAPPFEETVARPDITAPYLRRWLKNPIAVKPGTHMPILGLSDAEIEHYIAYLYSLKKSISP